MNLLITGGCGFIGSNFIRQRLTSRESPGPIKVVNLDKLTYAGNPANLADLSSDPRYVFVHGDIGDEALVFKLLAEHRIESVLNFAAESHVDRSIDSPEIFVQTNVLGALRLLNASRRYWEALDPACKGKFRFLQVSTDEVYGSLGSGDPPFTERASYAPNSPYAASKASADHLVRAFHHTYGFPVVTVNSSNNYGPWQFPEKLVPLMILNALEGRELPLFGDGGQIRDWLHVEDHARAIWRVLGQGRIGETYNVGGGNEQTNLGVVQMICDLLGHIRPRSDGRDYREQIVFVADRPGHDRRYAIDGEKIRRDLGWKPTESFLTGMEKTVSWYLNHAVWCAEINRTRYQRQRLGL